MKPTVEIQNWLICAVDDEHEILVGDAVDHPVLGSQYIHTSAIVRKDLGAGEVETRNTLYKLVGPKWMPAKASAASRTI